MRYITIFDPDRSMRFEVFDVVPVGTMLTTTEGAQVRFEGIDEAGLLICSHPDKSTDSYFPFDIIMPTHSDDDARRDRLAVAANAISAMQEADKALHEVFFRGRGDHMETAARHVAEVEAACVQLREVIGQELVIAAKKVLENGDVRERL